MPDSSYNKLFVFVHIITLLYYNLGINLIVYIEYNFKIRYTHNIHTKINTSKLRYNYSLYKTTF